METRTFFRKFIPAVLLIGATIYTIACVRSNHQFAMRKAADEAQLAQWKAEGVAMEKKYKILAEQQMKARNERTYPVQCYIAKN